MIVRNVNYYDDKGITDPMRDRNIETYEQWWYLGSDISQVHSRRSVFSPALNQPFTKYPSKHGSYDPIGNYYGITA